MAIGSEQMRTRVHGVLSVLPLLFNWQHCSLVIRHAARLFKAADLAASCLSPLGSLQSLHHAPCGRLPTPTARRKPLIEDSVPACHMSTFFLCA